MTDTPEDFIANQINQPRKYQKDITSKKKPKVNYKKQLVELLASDEIKSIKNYDEICTKYKPEIVKLKLPIKKAIKKAPPQTDIINYAQPAIKFTHEGKNFIIHNNKIYDEHGKFLSNDIKFKESIIIENNNIYNDKELGEFIISGNVLYKQISASQAILVGEIINDNVCIYFS